MAENIEEIDPTLWLRDGTLVYRLVQTGWRRGKPEGENAMMISVMPGKGETKETAIALAERLKDFLNSNPGEAPAAAE